MTIGLFWTLFAGFTIGMLMNAFKPIGDVPGMKRFLLTVGIGMVAAAAASLAGEAMHLFGREQFNAFLAAIVGALVVLTALRFATQARARAALPA